MTRYRGRFPNRPDSIAAMRGEVAAIAREYGLDEDAIHSIRLAVSEAATNAFVHGHAGVDADIILRVDVSAEEICVIIADQGAGIQPRTDSPGLGLGLPIIASVTGRMEIVSDGIDGATEVHMHFPRASS